MALKLSRIAAIAILPVFFVQPSDLESCGPFFPSAVFVRAHTPEEPMGILQRTYGRRYLVISYRTLMGIPLAPAQAADLRATPQDAVRPSVEWEKAREQVPGATTVRVEEYANGADYVSYRNCGDDAFLNAVKTLHDRIQAAGAASAEVRDWLAAQDMVFSNCGGKSHAIPTPPVAGSSARVIADREYQIAAAHFYAGHFEEAKTQFERIAQSEESPWRTIAPYLATRADIRLGHFRDAQIELESIVANPKQAAIHRQAALLLEYVEARVDPEKRFLTCAKRLLNPNSETLAHDLADYTFIYDKFELSNQASLHAAAALDDLTNWIVSFQGHGDVQPIAARWQRDHSLPWLIAALDHAWGTSPEAESLIEAAGRVRLESPAWATARFHAVRLLMEKDRTPEARKVLEEVTPRLADMPVSAANAFRAEKMKAAVNLREFLGNAPRAVAGESNSGFEEAATKTQQWLFDDDAAISFNQFVPLSGWLSAIHDGSFPAHLKSLLAEAGYVRAVILNDPSMAAFAASLKALKPGTSPPGAGGFEAAFWMLHHPETSPVFRSGFRRDTASYKIDNYRDNWWCAPHIAMGGSSLIARLYGSEWTAPAFLSAAERTQGDDEFKRLGQEGARAFLARSVVARAHSHPNDPRLPEALALAVKVSHFGCGDRSGDGAVAEAFRILHRRFPDSEWAKRTPYWYK